MYSESNPISLSDTLLAIIQSQFLLLSLSFAFKSKFSVSAAKPTVSFGRSELCFETKDNISSSYEGTIIMTTNFNYEKITKLFSNISTLDIKKLFNLKNDYEKLGYSSNEILIHLLELSTIPVLYGILVTLASILMFNLRGNNSIIIHVTVGFLVSVLIYYLMFFFSSLGNTGKIPINVSILFPIIILSTICTIGLIQVNEK